ncbi:methyl-accepting chemotaxis protein [Oscillospiraceae bacterium MB08-C2-2]|nr:methyl-accepting chemotaxis protein [Oscillospiraceae bacterium MB08-C2-2]
MKIGTKIAVGFACILILLIALAVTTVTSSGMTGSNIDQVGIYSGLQNEANSLLHILNETRVTAGLLYDSPTEVSYENVNKQLMYCDVRLKKLYEHIDSYPLLADLRPDIEAFEGLYGQWRTGLALLQQRYNQIGDFSKASAKAKEEYVAAGLEVRRVNLLAHEILSNTVLDIDDIASNKLEDTRSFNTVALVLAVLISIVSVLAAIFMAIVIVGSITKPIQYMRDVLMQIGQSGDLQIPQELQSKLETVAATKDEVAQCTQALLIMTERLHSVNETLACVADGDLTVDIALQSDRDTMGLAVEKMLRNLNQKFGTIARSTQQVHEEAGQLSQGSQLLASGSHAQQLSVKQLSDSVIGVSKTTEENTSLAGQAASLVSSIQDNAHKGTEQMSRMMAAATDINNASQAINKVIKVIDDIAFQTNILALNAAVEAARAGQHGKGFAVVADEVRNLASKSAAAAKDTSNLISDTIQKAEIGASTAKVTAKSLEDIVAGVEQSTSIINNIALLSQEQFSAIHQIITHVEHVEEVVQQNNSIASSSADAANEISDQSAFLLELVNQFQLLELPSEPASVPRLWDSQAMSL